MVNRDVDENIMQSATARRDRACGARRARLSLIMRYSCASMLEA